MLLDHVAQNQYQRTTTKNGNELGISIMKNEICLIVGKLDFLFPHGEG